MATWAASTLMGALLPKHVGVVSWRCGKELLEFKAGLYDRTLFCLGLLRAVAKPLMCFYSFFCAQSELVVYFSGWRVTSNGPTLASAVDWRRHCNSLVCPPMVCAAFVEEAGKNSVFWNKGRECSVAMMNAVVQEAGEGNGRLFLIGRRRNASLVVFSFVRHHFVVFFLWEKRPVLRRDFLFITNVL